MKLPKVIKIGGQKWSIKRKKMEDYGYIDEGTNTIYINKPLSTEKIKATLLHEILHAIIAQNGLSHLFKEIKGKSEHDVEEIFVWGIESCLASMIRFYFED